MEQKNKGRAKVKIAVFFVLAIHGIGLLALLMQGCKKEPATAAVEPTNNIAAPDFAPTSAPPMVDTSTLPSAVPSNPPPVVDLAPVPQAVTEYTIVAGDTYGKIAPRFHVTVAALTAANPGVDPTKLQVGKKIKIPPPASTTATTTTTSVTPANGETVYAVKSGDTLSKIATDFHTTVKALRAANNLKTDSIRVGQKLVIPKSNGAAPDAAPTNGTAK